MTKKTGFKSKRPRSGQKNDAANDAKTAQQGNSTPCGQAQQPNLHKAKPSITSFGVENSSCGKPPF